MLCLIVSYRYSFAVCELPNQIPIATWRPPNSSAAWRWTLLPQRRSLSLSLPLPEGGSLQRRTFTVVLSAENVALLASVSTHISNRSRYGYQILLNITFVSCCLRLLMLCFFLCTFLRFSSTLFSLIMMGSIILKRNETHLNLNINYWNTHANITQCI